MKIFQNKKRLNDSLIITSALMLASGPWTSLVVSAV